MKTLGYISLTAIILLASCSSQLYKSSVEYDDVYYIPNRTEAVIVQPSATTVPAVNNLALSPENIKSMASDTAGMTDYEKYRWALERDALGESSDTYKSEEGYYDDSYDYAYSQSEQYYDGESGTTVINNYYYGNNVYDNHDLYYSSRFRRFHRPYYSIGYYDPFYTDMFYYGFGPSYWGMSIYYGSPWRYSPWGHYGFSYGYSPWSYGYGWGSPWHYGHSYHGSYWRGYRHGFYDGYYGYGYSPYGYGWSSYRTVRQNDRNYYYGHRSSRSGFTPYSTASSGSAIRKSATETSDPRLRTRGESVSTDARKTGDVRGVDVANRTRTLDGSAGAVRTATPGGTQRSVAGSNERQRADGVGSGTQRSVGGTTRNTDRTQSTSGVYQRPATGQDAVRSTGTERTYTPSYTRPRTTSTPTYNRGESSPAQGNVRSGSTTTTRSSTPSSGNYTRPSTTTTRPSTTTRPPASTTTRPSTTTTRPAATPARTSPSYSRPAPAPSQSRPATRPSSSPSRSTYSAPASTPSRSSYSAPASSPSRSSSGSSVSSGSSRSSSGSSGGGATRSSSSSGSGRR